MTWIPYVSIWTLLALVVVVLAVYRRRIAKGEDETLHVLDAEAQMIPQQAALAQRLERVDRWGKLLTVLVVIYALLLGAWFLYSAWDQSTRSVIG